MPTCSKRFLAAALLGLASCATPPERAKPATPEAARGEGQQPQPSVVSEPRPESAPSDALPAPEARSPSAAGVRMEFHDADLRTVLLALAEEAGVSIVIAGDVRGTVTCILEDVSWLDALHAVAASAGYVVVHEGRRLAVIGG